MRANFFGRQVSSPPAVVQVIPWTPTATRDAVGLVLSAPTVTSLLDWRDWLGSQLMRTFGMYVPASLAVNDWDAVQSYIMSLLDADSGMQVGHTSTLLVTVPMSLASETLDDVEFGNALGDAFWAWFGTYVNQQGLGGAHADGSPKLVIRVGAQANGAQRPWAYGSDPAKAAQWRNAFDHIHDTFHAGESPASPGPSQNVRWAMGITHGQGSRVAVETAIPATADVLDMEVFDYDPTYIGATKNTTKWNAVWATLKTATIGLDWWLGMATTHSRLFGLAEVAVTNRVDDAGGEDNSVFFDNLDAFLVPVVAARRLFYFNLYEIAIPESVTPAGGTHDLRPSGGGTDGSATGSAFPLAAADAIILWGDTTPTPPPTTQAPWATSAVATYGTFHGSQSRSDHEAVETVLGRTSMFSLRFLTGGWAGANRPTSWTSSETAYRNIVSMTHDWFANRPDVTQIITCPLLLGGQTLNSAVNDASNQAFWTNFGTWCKDKGFLDTHADGRPFIILRVGWELDGSWYPWGTGFSSNNGGNRAINSPLFAACHDRAHEWFNDGAGAQSHKILWSANFMVSDRDAAMSASAIPTGTDMLTMENYDDLEGGAYYGSHNNPKTQSQKDAAYPAVMNYKRNAKTGLNWGVKAAFDRGLLWGVDEGGMYFDADPVGGRPEAGGDHALTINYWQDTLGWFNQVAAGGLPAGPQTLGILSHHILYNAKTSGGQGTTRWNPLQSYSPNARQQAIATY